MIKASIIYAFFLSISCFLTACGGSSSTPSSAVSSQAKVNSSSVPSSSVASSIAAADWVTLSGTVTYDFIPHNSNHLGLDYTAVEARPVRGALVELLDASGNRLASTNTEPDGTYTLMVIKNTQTKIRVNAQLLKTSTPSWNVKVTDNTRNNALYVLEGNLLSVGSTDSVRDLRAASGWSNGSYTAVRAAAPFAILDAIYTGVVRLSQSGNTRDLPPLEMRWSTKNKSAEGDYTLGEIGTSFFSGEAIYILGDANHDTDEYDAHVLLHEWGHYLETYLFRSDSLGGDHSDEDLLDARVAMSEGFANALSAIMLDDPYYADASGVGQGLGFGFNVGSKVRINKGYFSEGSVQSILYNFYTSNLNKNAKDFSYLFHVLNDSTYFQNDAMITVFLFYAQLKQLYPDQAALFNQLMVEQAIYGTDAFAANESNHGGLAINFPLYKKMNTNNIAVNVCSSSVFGKYNKLGNSQFLKVDIATAGSYTIAIQKNGGTNGLSQPEFMLFHAGATTYYAENFLSDRNNAQMNLVPGTYILEVYDKRNRDATDNAQISPCFDVQISAP